MLFRIHGPWELVHRYCRGVCLRLRSPICRISVVYYRDVSTMLSCETRYDNLNVILYSYDANFICHEKSYIVFPSFIYRGVNVWILLFFLGRKEIAFFLEIMYSFAVEYDDLLLNVVLVLLIRMHRSLFIINNHVSISICH